MQPIKNSIQQQININESKNLLYASVEQIIEIDPSFQAVLENLLRYAQQNDDNMQWVEFYLVPYSARTLIEKIYAINQYVRIEYEKVVELEAIYRHTWQEMLRTGDIQAILRNYHYPELSGWIATLYPKVFIENLESSPLIGSVVCEEYSVQLQVEALGINLNDIQEPVIDIGCGSHANFVRYLRSVGIEAYGFDRLLTESEFFLESADWLDYSFEPDTWGTITSNMAFTNHIVYTYQYDKAQFEQYMLKLKEILESLTVNGRFFYAPSLPFVEQALDPMRYKVERRQIVEGVYGSCITKIVG